MTATLLFDLDGTITETDHLHFEAFAATFAEHGVELDWDMYRSRVIGKVNPVIAADFLPHVDARHHAAIMDGKEVAYRDMVTTLQPVEGLTTLLDWAAASGLRCGVVTNAPRENAVFVLRQLGLTARFDVLVIGPELSDPKPHPLPYLRGLELLGGEAARSVAFEDSPAGARSAIAAKLAVVGLLTNVGADALTAVGASLVARDFADPAVLDFVQSRTSAAA